MYQHHRSLAEDPPRTPRMTEDHGCELTPRLSRIQLIASTRPLASIRQDALTRHWKGRPPRPVWRLLRQAVFERDGWACVYCGKGSGSLTCDHVLPVSRGGSSTLDNLVTACLACNTAKATKTPEEWRAQPRPRKRGR